MRMQSNQCRICGLLIPNEDIISIFTGKGKLRNIPEKISSCLPVTVCQDDLFSKNLCGQCATQLDNFYKFQEKSKSTDIKFKNSVSSGSVPEAVTVCFKEEPCDFTSCSQSISPYNVEQPMDPLMSIQDEQIINNECSGPSSQNFNFTLLPKLSKYSSENEMMEVGSLKNLKNLTVSPDFQDGNKMKAVYQCAYCNLNFSSVNSSETHIIEKHHKERLAMKAIREKTISPTEKLPLQVNIPQGDKNTSQSDKNTSVKTKTTTMFRCTYCKLMFTTREASASHILEAHKKEREERFALSEIKQNTEPGKSSKSTSDTTLSAKQVFRCKSCNMFFASAEDIQVHVKEQHSKQHNCDYCHKKFSTKEELSIHDQSCWIPKLQKYKKNIECYFCGSKFSSIKSIEHHILKCHLCLECGKIYGESSGGSMRYHKRIHEMSLESRKKKECNICGARYIQKSTLVVHMRRHTGERPFVCHLCPKKYTSCHGLTKHLFLHSGVKAHKCDMCDKSFARAEYLRVHVRTHTGERPFMCDICGRCFTQQSALNVHCKLHGKSNLTCDKCGTVGKSRLALLRHMKTHLLDS